MGRDVAVPSEGAGVAIDGRGHHIGGPAVCSARLRMCPNVATLQPATKLMGRRQSRRGVA
jgi:hypothetical protein